MTSHHIDGIVNTYRIFYAKHPHLDYSYLSQLTLNA